MRKNYFGLNNLHFRFALSSMFQYVSAIFNNFYLGVEGITIPIAITVSIFIYFLSKELFFYLRQNSDLSFLVSSIYLIIIVSSLYSFSRYSNYGNDVSLHVFYFVIFLLSVNFFLKREYRFIQNNINFFNFFNNKQNNLCFSNSFSINNFFYA